MTPLTPGPLISPAQRERLDKLSATHIDVARLLDAYDTLRTKVPEMVAFIKQVYNAGAGFPTFREYGQPWKERWEKACALLREIEGHE